MTRWLLLGLMVAGCSGAEPVAGEQPDLTSLRAALGQLDWHWRYITAAIGGDRSETWRLEGDGTAHVTRRAWVVDSDGADDWVQHDEQGTYALGESGDLSIDWTDADGVTRQRTGRVAVLTAAPQRKYDAGARRVVSGPAALATRALRGNGVEYTTSYGARDGDVTEAVGVQVRFATPLTSARPGDELLVSFSATANAEDEDGPSTGTLEYTFAAVLREADEGPWWVVEAADPELALAPYKLAYQNMPAQASHAVEGLLIEAAETVFALDPARPGLVLTMYSSSPDSGWRAGKAAAQVP